MPSGDEAGGPPMPAHRTGRRAGGVQAVGRRQERVGAGMFCTVDLRAARWWLAGILIGLMGWAIWASVDRSQPVGGLAFERQFWPASQPEGRPSRGAATQELVQVSPAAEGAPAGRLGAAGPSAERRQVAARDDGTAGDRPIPAVADADATIRRGRLDPDAFRAERERLRSREMELATRVLEDPNASDERKSQAQLELVQLLQKSRRELEIEQLLAAAGVEGAVVSIGEAGVQVVVPQPLTVQSAARIGELVARMAGVRRETISIIDSATAFASGPGREESPMSR